MSKINYLKKLLCSGDVDHLYLKIIHLELLVSHLYIIKKDY
jgi:hypothetical protein